MHVSVTQPQHQGASALGDQSLQVPCAINSKSKLSLWVVQWRNQPSARAIFSTHVITGQGGAYPNLTISRCGLDTT